MRLAFAWAALAAAAVLRPIAAQEEPQSCLHWSTADWCDEAAEEPISSLQVSATLDLNRGARESQKKEQRVQTPRPSQVTGKTKAVVALDHQRAGVLRRLSLSTLTARAAKLLRQVQHTTTEPRFGPVIFIILVLFICLLTVTCLVTLNNAHKLDFSPPRRARPKPAPAPMQGRPVMVYHPGPAGYSMASLASSGPAGKRKPKPPKPLDPRVLKFPGERLPADYSMEGWLPQMTGSDQGWLPGLSTGSLWGSPPATGEEEEEEADARQLQESEGYIVKESSEEPVANRSCSGGWFAGVCSWFQDDSQQALRQSSLSEDSLQPALHRPSSGADLSALLGRYDSSELDNIDFAPKRVMKFNSSKKTRVDKDAVTTHFLLHNRLTIAVQITFMMKCNFLIDKDEGNFEVDILNNKGIHVMTCVVQRRPLQAFLAWSTVMDVQHLASCEPSGGGNGYPLKVVGLYNIPWGTLEPEDPRSPSTWVAKRHDKVALVLRGVPTNLEELGMRSLVEIGLYNAFDEELGVVSHSVKRKTNVEKKQREGHDDFFLRVTVAPGVDMGLILLSVISSLTIRPYAPGSTPPPEKGYFDVGLF